MMETIDRVTKCQIDPANASTELTTLRYLRFGLCQLYEKVVTKEKPLRESDDAKRRWRASYMTTPELGADDLIPCYFHWYGISILNYARLVGFLCGLSLNKFTRSDLHDKEKFDKITQYCDSYVKDVGELSPIKFWRDKSAAHFAITAPKIRDDNPALLDLSVMYPVAYSDGRYRVGVFSLRRTDSAGNLHTGKFPGWSLTETHEALQPRYNWN
jgi:hypothetical protein